MSITSTTNNNKLITRQTSGSGTGLPTSGYLSISEANSSAALSNIKIPKFSSTSTMSSNKSLIHGKKSISKTNLQQTPLKISPPMQIVQSTSTSKITVLEKINDILKKHAWALLECYALSDLGIFF